MVDKNLFLHDLAVVAILKDEGNYLKEWLDYHLLAGVEHFYLYDNDSTDNQAEVAKPYVEAGLVDYFYLPGKAMQMVAYNDAFKRFKFFNRYMAFIDLDEFIYPKSNRAISEVVDEILSCDQNAAGLSFHWQIFGSNGHEIADYSRGVLERFTRRAPSDDGINKFVKTIADPRKIRFSQTMHFMYFFEPFYSVTEKLKLIINNVSLPIVTEKIVVNHYHAKSFEEYKVTKMRRGWPCGSENPYSDKLFNTYDRNEVFDDGILKYRAARAEKFSLESDAARFNRVTEALTETLSGAEFSLETALTCRALSAYLCEHFPNDADYWKICEEASVGAILKSLEGINITDAQLLIRELPNLLTLPYPAVKDLRNTTLQIISLMKNIYHLNYMWKDYIEMDYISDLLKE